MKAAALLLSAAALLPAALRAQSGSPFVETSTLTFYWGFTSSYVTNANTPIPALPDFATFDPDTLPDKFETFTDTYKARAYTGPTAGAFAPAGGNKQIIELLLQRLVRSGRIGAEELSWRWQLIAVREAPANVHELATNPYRVFLSGQAPSGRNTMSATSYEISHFGPEPIIDDPVPLRPPSFYDSTPSSEVVTLDTGITITLGQYSGSYTETNWGASDNRVRSASGTVSTAFHVDFGAIFYEDPLHAQRTPKIDPYNYHLNRHYWEAKASGEIKYNIRTIKPPVGTTLLPSFVATSSTATATGWFYHEHATYTGHKEDNVVFYRLVLGSEYSSGGLAPLKIALSTIQYQKRDRFSLAAPATPNSVFTETVVDGGVSVSWSNPENETGFVLERSFESPNGPWVRAVTTDANGTPYLDLGLTVDSFYYYRVYAFNGAGNSAYSPNIGVASTIVAPANVDAGANSSSQITVKWTFPATNDLETGFELQRRRDGTNNWLTIDADPATPEVEPLDPDTTSYPDTGLSSSTKYFYRVRALHAPYGASAWSNIDDASTTAPATNTNAN